ncbi:MAG: hypothetical protein JOY61_16940, partial [Chloroflexi bacterium]|nr:hypothetical protein [Chloroflexota bacterium]
MPNTDTTLPRALGLFSLGLGTVQVLAPGALTKLIGLKNGKSSKTVMRLVGVRELGAAAGVLTRKQSAPWLWSRVAGDAMDLGLLGAAVMDDRNDRARLSA